MMVITTVSDRPVTDPAGTIGALVRLRATRRVRPWVSAGRSARPPAGTVRVRPLPSGAPVCGPSK